MMVSATAAGS